GLIFASLMWVISSSGSMMLLTVYGGYLCILRAQRYMQRQKQLEAQNESAASETIKD
uniref:Cytochrome c oxidase assembly factor COX14 n=1 Tax=Sinocyclocheilus anshuiensis TaxID=1608454 RepID=A0A671SDA0_9TELE